MGRVLSTIVILTLGAALANCKPAASPGIAFVHDDAARAFELAARTHRPLVVDVTASWCVPCRKMQTVFASAAVRSLEDRFVWLSVDADSKKNEHFFEQHRPPGLPTIWVFEPRTQKVVLEWVGVTDVDTMRGLLLAGEEISSGPDVDDKSLATRLAASLEELAARATTVEDRMEFDDARLAAYLAAGTPEKAIPMLERSEADKPKYFASPAGLAKAYLALGRLDEASSAIDRARSRVAGWPSLKVLELAADIARERKDIGGERSALAQAVARTIRLPLPREEYELRGKLRERLAQLAP